MSALDEAVDVLERVLCARYNVPSIEGLGDLPDALEAARSGNVTPLEEAMAGREMYHWADESREALAALRDPQRKVPTAEDEAPDKPAEDEASETPPKPRRRT